MTVSGTVSVLFSCFLSALKLGAHEWGTLANKCIGALTDLDHLHKLQVNIMCLLPWWRATLRCLRTSLCISHASAVLLIPPQEALSCITSFKDKKHSVVSEAQMVCKALNRLSNSPFWPLNKKTSVSTGPVQMDVPWVQVLFNPERISSQAIKLITSYVVLSHWNWFNFHAISHQSSDSFFSNICLFSFDMF